MARRPVPTLAQRVRDAVSKGRNHAQVAEMISPVDGIVGPDQDLPLMADAEIYSLIGQLSREIEDRRRLVTALKAVLDRR